VALGGFDRGLPGVAPVACVGGDRRVRPVAARAHRGEERILRVVGGRHFVEKGAVIGHRQEVERAGPELEAKAARMVDRFSAREPVGVVRIGADAEQVGVDRVPRVDVEIAEVGVLERVRWGRGLRGCEQGRDQDNAAEERSA